MAEFRTIDDLDVTGKRVLLRGDLNVPLQDGVVTDTLRLDRLAGTIFELTERGARIVVISHLGRPKGKPVPELSLKPIAEALSKAIGGRPVAFAGACIGAPAEAVVGALENGAVAVLENLRFEAGEEANDPEFAGALAALGDYYVNDAFSVSHRAHASTVAIARLLPAAAGRALQAELDALERALGNPDRPLAALVGGAKVSTKIGILENLAGRVDSLVIGGAMANTFLLAAGKPIGASLAEPEMIETARRVVAAAKRAACVILLPIDAVIAPALEPGVASSIVPIDAVPPDQMILDIGPETTQSLIVAISGWRTLVWNGPLGAFETPPFDAGTTAIARAAAKCTRTGILTTVAGGGDTVAALAHTRASQDFTHISAAGGAFLEWLEGKDLPGLAVLRKPG